MKNLLKSERLFDIILIMYLLGGLAMIELPEAVSVSQQLNETYQVLKNSR